MNNPLIQREAFHIVFLSWLLRVLPPSSFVLKGGVNLRFFFESPRYSEDMDLDVEEIPVDNLVDKTMHILTHREMRASLEKSGITEIVPPNLRYAKQTETVQRFKIHLLTDSGLDLFTKIEFSRRGFNEGIVAEPISTNVARNHRIIPFVIQHYSALAAAYQKVKALVGRAKPQSRDIFDLFLLIAHLPEGALKKISKQNRREAIDRVLLTDYNSFKGGVLEFLNEQDRRLYGTPDMWETIQLKVIQALEDPHGTN